jgi:hypothetical protein
MSKRYVVRKPWDGEYNPETELDARGVTQSAREYDAWLEDTASPGRVVHGDGGAPEDQTLLRDLSSFVDELNALADALVQAEKLAASRYQQIEFLKSQNESYRIDNKVLCEQMEALRVQLRAAKGGAA